VSVGERIKHNRKRSNFSQKRLAELSGINTVQLSQYERGVKNPKYETLKKIAVALDVPLNNFVNPEEPDREYECISDTLNDAGYRLEPAGIGCGPDEKGDRYYIIPDDEKVFPHWPKHEDDPVWPEYPQIPSNVIEIQRWRLSEVFKMILVDAEKKKKEYIQKRLAAELFGWEV
jgi:transcriptional regulator with XRE-family HTH domain